MTVETSNRTLWVQVSRSVRSIPVDLLLVLTFVVVVNVVFRLPGLREASLSGASVQTLLGVPTLFFLPGYVLTAALFPRRAGVSVGGSDPRVLPVQSIDLVERLALSFGLSVALLPLLGIALGTWWTITAANVLTVVSVFAVVGVGLAAVLRRRQAAEVRFGRSIGDVIAHRPRVAGHSDGIGVRAVTIGLALAVVVAFGAIGFTVATPYQSGESSTLFLTAENETGAQVASNFPTNLSVGDSESVSVGITNDEERQQPYTVVVAMERVEADGRSTTVTESREVSRLHPVVASGETWTESHEIVPELEGTDLRLHYYLYRGETGPATPEPASAYRDVYVWVDVSGP